MAKSAGFFGLRRGSTKSLTFSVLRGEQITKDRVADVANPQTLNQGVQRSIFAAAAKFYSKLQFILDHSWEGFAYETPSQSEFMRKALKTLLGTQLEKGEPAYPFNYQISAGSLPRIDRDSFDWSRSLTGVVSRLRADFSADLDVRSVLLDINPQLRVGDNITFVGWDNLGNACAITWTIPEDLTTDVDNWPASEINGVVPSGVNTNFGECMMQIALDGNQDFLAMRNTESPLNEWVNGTFILSRQENGTWKRSSAYFVMDGNTPMSSLKGAETYVKGYTSVRVQSDYQLNVEENWLALITAFDINDVRSTYQITKGGALLPVQEIWKDGELKAIKWYAVEKTYNGHTRQYLARPNGSVYNWSAETFEGHTELLTDESILIPIDSVATGSPVVEKVVEVVAEGSGTPIILGGTLTMNA